MASVAIYLRLSDEDRDKKNKLDESESIQNQKSMLREYCAERNWDIYDIYSDEDFSGADSTRPEFNRMLRDCEKGRIDIVLCKSQSRFSRDMEMIEKYIHNKFVEWGVRFVGVVDRADTEDISNKKARQINGLINEWYLEDSSENIRRTLKHKREQGEFTGSFAPYGYLVDPQNNNHLLIDKNTAPIVKDIFNWYLQGWGYRKIVIELNKQNIPSPSEYKRQIKSNYVNKNELKSSSSGLWTAQTIYRMIRNEAYTGTLVQGKSHTVSYKNKKRISVPTSEWIRVSNSHEAIISEEVWLETQNRLANRVRACKSTMNLSPLSGKVKCAECKRAMKRKVYHNKSRTKTYYSLQCATYKVGAMNCSNKCSISGTILESFILKELNNYIDKYCKMDEIEIYDIQAEKNSRAKDTIRTYNSQINGIGFKLQKLYDDKLEGIITKEQYLLYSKKYNDEIANIESKCRILQREVDAYESLQTNINSKKELLKKYSHFDSLTYDVVNEFIDEIYVGGKDLNENRTITINWKF